MIEAYAFLAMFMAQILAGSLLFPERVIRRVRGWAKESGSERFLQLYPETDFDKSIQRFATLFRAANIVTAAIGFLMLGWFYLLVQQPGWADDIKMRVVGYIFVQFAPLALLALYGVVRGFRLLVHPPLETKRTAILQRRGLLDFMSPFAVLLAVLSYFGFVAFAMYLDLEVYGNATLSRQCYIAIAAVTGVHALNAFVIYKYLYGRKNPFQSHEGRAHSIAVNVKSFVYGGIATTWFFSLLAFVGQPHLKEWQPFALALFLTATWVLNLMTLSSPPRKPESDDGYAPA